MGRALRLKGQRAVRRLQRCGVFTLTDLKTVAASPAARERLAAKSGLPLERIEEAAKSA